MLDRTVHPKRDFPRSPASLRLLGKHDRRCIWVYGKRHEIRNCLTCGEEFKASFSLIAKGGGKYCSRECYYSSPIVKAAKSARLKGKPSFNKGKKGLISEDGRRRISEGRKGKPSWCKGKKRSEESRKKMSEAKKGIIPWNKGKTGIYSEETLQKIRDARKRQVHPLLGKHLSEEHKRAISRGETGKVMSESARLKISIAMKGEKHPLWKGGISFYPYCKKFNKTLKEEVREIFDRKCLNCGCPEDQNVSSGGKQRKLSIHHIYYDKQEGCNGKEMALAPLCLCCHGKTGSGNRNYWMKVLAEKRLLYLQACGKNDENS